MSDGGSDDKEHEPSQKKLDDARKKGEVAKSTDLLTSAAYAGFILAVLLGGSSAFQLVANTLMSLLSRAPEVAAQLFGGSATPIVGGLILKVGEGSAILMGVPAVLVILTLIAQRGLVIAPSRIAPKGSRISILSNAKNKFGRSGFFEFFKSFAKLAIYSALLGIHLWRELPRLIGAIQLEPPQVAVEVVTLSFDLLIIVLAISLVLGVVDLIWQKAEHIRKNRMSRKELTDEMKNSNGDPAMKQLRRQRGMEIAMNKMLADVSDANVVIVNPTHYAVALSWDPAKPSAPVCVAKGVDEIAARIRERASEAGVPIKSDPPTARAIYATVEIGQEIGRDHYRAVAAAIRFADAIRARYGK